MPFLELKLKDFLKQAVSDIITLLSQPPSTTVPSLAVGDPVRNTLLTLAKPLKLKDNIPDPLSTKQSVDMSLPKVKDVSLPRVEDVSLSRVKDNTIPRAPYVMPDDSDKDMKQYPTPTPASMLQ